MVPQPSSDSDRRAHLRLVGGAEGNNRDAGRSHIQTDGLPALSPAEARAKAIKREAEVFKASRNLISRPSPEVRPSSALHRGEEAPSAVVPIELEELGARFEALAPPVAPNLGTQEAQRIDAALAALRASAPLDSYPELWPTVHLRALAAADPSSAGRWLIAMLSQLHRIAPTGILDLRMASGQTIRAAARGDETRLDWAATPSRSVPFVKASERKLAELALGVRKPRRRQRDGVRLLRRLAAAPISISDLAATGTAVLDPYAFWKLVQIARPSVLNGISSRVVHIDPFRPDYSVSVELVPGTPIQISLGESSESDAQLSTSGPELLNWAAFADVSAVGSAYLGSGDADAEVAALRAVGRSDSPIRSNS